MRVATVDECILNEIFRRYVKSSMMFQVSRISSVQNVVYLLCRPVTKGLFVNVIEIYQNIEMQPRILISNQPGFHTVDGRNPWILWIFTISNCFFSDFFHSSSCHYCGWAFWGFVGFVAQNCEVELQYDRLQARSSSGRVLW